MNSSIYHFGDYRLDATARELWHEDGLVTLPRRAFEGLVFLVEHRHRAVSYDELIEVLWGHPHVANARVSQLIMQIRRAVGDDSQRQDLIRTLPGYGYRWIRALDDSGGTVAQDDSLGRQVGDAIAVLPMQVEESGQSDVAWIRLGVMDLIAEHLRGSGLTVVPSDSVVAALHVADRAETGRQRETLRRTLGADVLIRGRLRADDGDWTITLIASATEGTRRRIECRNAEIMVLARRSANLLLAALGRKPVESRGENTALREWIQRVRAAVLANELDVARAVLEAVPGAAGEAPELQYERAYVAYQSGDFETAQAVVSKLLDASGRTISPRLRARTLILRGRLVARTTGFTDWDRAERDFDAAVGALEDAPWAVELGSALANRGVARAYQHRFLEAIRDLGRARTQCEIAGDRRGTAYVYNHFGLLEIKRHRVAEALLHFDSAARISRAFGAIDWLRGHLTGAMEARIRLLQWGEALRNSAQIRALKPKVKDPELRVLIDAHHAFVLVALGRHREAEDIMSRIHETDFTPPFISFGHRARALLEWQRGRIPEALAAADKVLRAWPITAGLDADQRARLALLRQRAALALAAPDAGARPAGSIPAEQPVTDDVRAVYVLARAEWAAAGARDQQAGEWFEQASRLAESECVPDTVALVAEAQARWMLKRGDIAGASGLAGRLMAWSEHDFDCALLQVRVMHASGCAEAWARTLRRVRHLAGERVIPAFLLEPPQRFAGKPEAV